MKNTFLKSTFILLIGGFITKIFGFIIKIIYTNLLGTEGIALHSLVMPTYSLLITLANFNIQAAISKRISNKKRAKKVLISSCYIMLILNTIIILTTILLSKTISHNLLKNKDTFLPIIACSLTLPFISIGYIIKGYFYGKQNMSPHMISNIIEQIFRLLIISIFLPKISNYGLIWTVTSLILFNILSESVSIIILFFFLPKNFKIKKKDLLPNKYESKEILNITVPSISGRLLGNIGYFFEPIILTNILLYKGMDLNTITLEYGIYNAYSISLLLFPSFFISAISNALMPEISKLQSENNINKIKKRIKQSLTFSFIIGILCTTFIYIFKEELLLKLYNTNEGINYIKTLTPFFILFYLESPLASILIGLNKIKTCTIITVSGIIIKLISMSILAYIGLGIYALIISEIINIIYVTLLNYTNVKKSIYT